MKKILFISIILCITSQSFAQKIYSGFYGVGLSLAFDSTTKKITGYYENATGYDENTKSPRFTCTFYIEGIVNGNIADILTFYPEYFNTDTISGRIEIVDSKNITIKLRGDHGGCWNVQQFANEPLEYTLDREIKAIQIRYVISNKAHFYSEKNNLKKRKAFVLKYDVVAVEKIESNWAYCTFYGNKITKGWIKVSNLN